jgi:hypothetical protein
MTEIVILESPRDRMFLEVKYGNVIEFYTSFNTIEFREDAEGMHIGVPEWATVKDIIEFVNDKLGYECLTRVDDHFKVTKYTIEGDSKVRITQAYEDGSKES